MDLLSHGLWAGAAAAWVRLRFPLAPQPRWVALWGMFPDLLAAGMSIPLMVRDGLDGSLSPASARAVSLLYNFGHNLVVGALVFGLVWMLLKRPPLAMLGWPLHVLIDMATHGRHRGGTQFLWPFSSVALDGVTWRQPWFLAVDVLALAAVWLAYWAVRRTRAIEPGIAAGRPGRPG